MNAERCCRLVVHFQAEFDREQEFFRSAQLLGSRDRERVSDAQALSFMYQVKRVEPRTGRQLLASVFTSKCPSTRCWQEPGRVERRMRTGARQHIH